MGLTELVCRVAGHDWSDAELDTTTLQQIRQCRRCLWRKIRQLTWEDRPGAIKLSGGLFMVEYEEPAPSSL